MIKLKSCPFCGGQPEMLRHLSKRYLSRPDIFLVQCTNCKASFNHIFDTEKDAVEAWNHRAEGGKKD